MTETRMVMYYELRVLVPGKQSAIITKRYKTRHGAEKRAARYANLVKQGRLLVTIHMIYRLYGGLVDDLQKDMGG